MSSSTSQKINQVINPKFLGFQIEENSNINYDAELVKEVDRLYELSNKLKEKIMKSVPASSQIKSESKQPEEQEIIENLNQIQKKFSFQSVDNLKKNIHLFDPKLERVKHDLHTQAQQQKMKLFMNSLSSFSNQASDQLNQGDNKNNMNNKLNNTVTQCLQILESRWQTELKMLDQKN